MRYLVPLLLLSCGTTLDGGIHAEACGNAAAAGLPICRTGDRCNSANDCIPACTFVGCVEGACTYRTGTCQTPSCANEATAALCLTCALAPIRAEAALTECLCSACGTACGNTGLCRDGGGAVTDACAACAVESLVHPGVCAQNSAFQDACFGGSASTCRAQAQGVVACRR